MCDCPAAPGPFSARAEEPTSRAHAGDDQTGGLAKPLPPSEEVRSPVIARDVLRKRFENAVGDLFAAVVDINSGTYTDNASLAKCYERLVDNVRWFREVQRAQSSKHPVQNSKR